MVTSESALSKKLEEEIRQGGTQRAWARPVAPSRPFNPVQRQRTAAGKRQTSKAKRQPWPRVDELASLERVLAGDEMQRRDPYWYGAPTDKITPDEYRRVQSQARIWAGHWFNDKEVKAWLALGVRRADAAAQWRQHGFPDAAAAAPWLNAGVQQPSQAAVFVAANVTPEMLEPGSTGLMPVDSFSGNEEVPCDLR